MRKASSKGDVRPKSSRDKLTKSKLNGDDSSKKVRSKTPGTEGLLSRAKSPRKDKRIAASKTATGSTKTETAERPKTAKKAAPSSRTKENGGVSSKVGSPRHSVKKLDGGGEKKKGSTTKKASSSAKSVKKTKSRQTSLLDGSDEAMKTVKRMVSPTNATTENRENNSNNANHHHQTNNVAKGSSSKVATVPKSDKKGTSCDGEEFKDEPEFEAQSPEEFYQMAQVPRKGDSKSFAGSGSTLESEIICSKKAELTNLKEELKKLENQYAQMRTDKVQSAQKLRSRLEGPSHHMSSGINTRSSTNFSQWSTFSPGDGSRQDRSHSSSRSGRAGRLRPNDFSANLSMSKVGSELRINTSLDISPITSPRLNQLPNKGKNTFGECSSARREEDHALQQLAEQISNEKFQQIQEIFNQYSSLGSSRTRSKTMDLTQFHRYIKDYAPILGKYSYAQADLLFFRNNKAKTINLRRFVEILFDMAKKHNPKIENDVPLAVTTMVAEMGRLTTDATEDKSSTFLNLKSILLREDCQKHLRSRWSTVTKMFNSHQDKCVENSNEMTIKGYLACLHKYEIIPELVTRSEATKIFKFCHKNAKNFTGSETLKPEEFGQSLGILALKGFDSMKFNDQFATPQEKIEALFQMVQIVGPSKH